MRLVKRAAAFIMLVGLVILIIILCNVTTAIYSESSSSTISSSKSVCISRMRYSANRSTINNPERYLIDACVDEDQCYGWGDRQRAIVTTYLISLLTDRRFGIYMTNPCRLENFLAPNKVDWIVNKEELDGLCKRDFYMFNDHVLNFRHHRMVESADFDQLFPEDVIYLHTAQDYMTSIRRNQLAADKIPWIHKYSLGKVYGSILRHVYKLNNKTQNIVTDLMSRNVQNRTLVCAHIRMGIKGVDLVRTATSEMQIIWNFLYRYNDVLKYKIYVATDSNETKLEAKKLFRDQIFDTVGIIEQMERARSCEAFKRVIIEQEILTKCDILMLTRSSLGFIAAFLRDTNRGLYCLFKERVFPCNMEILHELMDGVI